MLHKYCCHYCSFINIIQNVVLLYLKVLTEFVSLSLLLLILDTFALLFFLGWPKILWFVTEHLSKPPKDWLPPARQPDDAPAYIEVHTHLLNTLIKITFVITL